MTYTGSKANCQALNTLQNELQGYPIPGVHIGGGIHVDMPKTWDGVGKVPPGWTAYSDDAIAPTADLKNYTTPVDAKTQDAASVAKLPAPDQATLTAVLSAGTITAVPIADPIAEEITP